MNKLNKWKNKQNIEMKINEYKMKEKKVKNK